MSDGNRQFNPDRWVWGTDDRSPRFLHVMLRVRDIDASIRFYCDVLGMKQLGDRFEFPERRVTGVVLGYGDYSTGGCIELIQGWDGPPAGGDAPDRNWHFALGVPDMQQAAGKVEAAGMEFLVQPRVLIDGGPLLAFFKDPDGYVVELIQTRRARSEQGAS